MPISLILALLPKLLAYIPSISEYANLAPEALAAIEAIYGDVSKIITDIKGAPLDAKGEAALDALILWQSQQPWGGIEPDDLPK